MTRWELFARNLWLHLRRAPRDLRSLKVVAALLLLLAYAVYICWAVFFLGFWASVATALSIVIAYVIALLIAKSHRRSDTALLKLSAPASLDDVNGPDAAQREALRAMLYTRAAFADRAGLEVMLKHHASSDVVKGSSRRRTIDFAKKTAIWEQLNSEEREMLMAPEGTWGEVQRNERILWAEDVRVLRWVLCMDRVLAPFEFSKLDVSVALDITLEKIRPGKRCLASWDVRPARDWAIQMLLGGFEEGLHRGMYVVEEDQLEPAFKENGRDTDSLLVGKETVRAATDDRVHAVTQLAYRRAAVLQEVVKILTTSQEFPASYQSARDSDQQCGSPS